jgi:hypothetical protein
MAWKVSDAWTAALCVTCHTAIDSGPNYSREDRRDLMNHAILLTIRELAARKLIVPT